MPERPAESEGRASACRGVGPVSLQETARRSVFLLLFMKTRRGSGRLVFVLSAAGSRPAYFLKNPLVKRHKICYTIRYVMRADSLTVKAGGS